ncbi:Aldehyde Dehydrogenase X [Manis pentadactyla]|nr:Aldehyde Dehydrogenase X [Manis pentadactyla]
MCQVMEVFQNTRPRCLAATGKRTAMKTMRVNNQFTRNTATYTPFHGLQERSPGRELMVDFGLTHRSWAQLCSPCERWRANRQTLPRTSAHDPVRERSGAHYRKPALSRLWSLTAWPR